MNQHSYPNYSPTSNLILFDSSSFSLELQDALKEQTPRLNNELKQLIGEFLELTSKGEIDL